jgi:RimJ/RimL family protein N-acetyltransferase
MNAPAPWKAPSPLPTRFETRRLVIRFWEPEDANSLLEGIEQDRSAFLPWLPWVKSDNRNLAECVFNIERFRRTRETTADDFVLGLFDRETGHAVGGTGLHRMHAPSHHGEIGYFMFPDKRRQGLCTEAVAGLISWAFIHQNAGGWGLRRLDIFCAAGNIASQRVPRKLGLRQEVNKSADRWVDGIGWDGTLGWGVLSEEWDTAAQKLRPSPK